MNLSRAIDLLGSDKSMAVAQQGALSLSLPWDNDMKIVFQICLKDQNRRPNVQKETVTPEELILKWVKNYERGYNNRPSKSAGKAPQTSPDIIIDEVIRARIPSITEKEMLKIRFAHRLSMSVENILGLLLEEYLATKLRPSGWACAWGQTLKSVDFCHENDRLLQVKNRSNTENSSSNKIRKDTEIELWYRIDAKTGNHRWEDLQRIINVNVSESDFREFIINVVSQNPKILILDQGSPWNSAFNVS